MADLDLENFLKEGSLADLDWLDVDEAKYHEFDALPKQNLDTSPDLEALWRHRDESPSQFVPNTGAPRTMGDLSEVHGRLASTEAVVKTARLAIMQTTDPQALRSILATRFDQNTLHQAKTALSSVFAERGLLGKFYIDASDFPGCDRGGKAPADFVKKYASEAKFVLAKTACQGCTHRQVTPAGQSHCSVFHKEIQVDVPYSEAIASQVEREQAARGRVVQASEGTPRERVQRALLAAATPATAGYSGHSQFVPPQTKVDPSQVLIAAENLTKKRDAENQQKLAAAKARPIVALLRREMLKGRSNQELVHALRLAFDLNDLKATQSEWMPLLKEAGLYGAVYLTQDSFESCHEGADFISRHASKVRAVVKGEKCASCIFNKVSRCMLYGRKLAESVEEVLTPEMVQTVLQEHRMAGTLPDQSAKFSWGETPVEALKAIHAAASLPAGTASSAPLRSAIETAFYGSGRTVHTGANIRRDIVKAASQYMNEGLYGSDLMQVLKTRFEVRDLLAAAQDLKVVLAEQGLQGIKYVDPTVYDDYGKGCDKAASKHRSRSAVKYAKIGDKCASCVHHARPGFCSVLNKQLVVEPPYIDKLAEQQAVLDSGRSTEVGFDQLMNNGLSMMQEYQLRQADTIDLNPEVVSLEALMEFGSQKVKL